MSVTFKCVASDTRKPDAYNDVRIARCFVRWTDSRKRVTSSGLRTTGSLKGFLGIGMSSTAHGCRSLTLYKKRSAETAMLMLMLLGASLRSSTRCT